MNAEVRAVHLGLGGNQGEREEILGRALERIAAWPDTLSVEASPTYETAYVGPHGPQAPYLNLCARIRTTASAREILERTRRLEEREGRPAERHQRPRRLDIDLLVDGSRMIDEPGLRVPHPRLRERRFVLQPLADLDPELRLPPDGARVADLLERPEVLAQELHRWEVGS